MGVEVGLVPPAPAPREVRLVVDDVGEVGIGRIYSGRN